MGMRRRVVIDTNVRVGTALSAKGSHNREVLRHCLKGHVQPVLGVALFSEYEELFLRDPVMAKSPLSETERRTLLEAFLSVYEWGLLHLAPQSSRRGR
jgi:predicted nucleic acid-binding protein